MKKRSVKYLAFVFIAGICYVHPLAGQEGGFNFHNEDVQKEFNPSRDGLPHQSENTNSYSNSQDDDGNTAVRQKAKKTTVEPSTSGHKKNEKEHNSNPVPVVEQQAAEEENANSVLSFNFLHYLIQKFKFSDVVDQ